MSHRPGHVEDSGEAMYAMDRRKYLSTLAAGAALGTVAIGLAACGGGGSETKSTTDSAAEEGHDHALAPAQTVTGQNLWGYLRVFPPGVVKVADANPALLQGVDTIRIPFYNNTGLDLSTGPVLGFTLLTIGCPAQFALAINLTRDDHAENELPPPDESLKRHREMDAALLGMGYKALPWTGQETTPCP